ncbi:hypothetical protein OROGR_026532 [Orobanche gracilis]
MEEKRILILAQVVVEETRSDYYIVDLEAGEILKTEIQSLLNGGEGDMVKLGRIIYNIGGLRLIDECPPVVIPAAYGDHHRHLGASCIDLNSFDDNDDAPPPPPLHLSKKWKWKDIPPMNDFRVYPSCVSLDGKLYALHCLSQRSHIGEVFDPCLGQWEPLPPPPSDIPVRSMFVSPRVISDEKKHRLLVHIANTYSLYAYYPDLRSWDCLAPAFSPWFPPAAITLVDDILFLTLHDNLPRCIAAFDLLSKTWLEVKFSSNFPAYDIAFNEWESMLHLGDGNLCLATFRISGGNPVQTNLWFVKLRFQRISSQDLLLTFVSSHQFPPFQGRLRANCFIIL